MGSPLLEVNQKPAVLLAVLGKVPVELVRALEYGLEEEGIPCEQQEQSGGTTAAATEPIAAASRAAKTSRINVGLGISREQAALHHRDLPQDRPLFSLTGRELSLESLYRLGRNAARLVKGNPFIFEGQGTDDAEHT